MTFEEYLARQDELTALLKKHGYDCNSDAHALVGWNFAHEKFEKLNAAPPQQKQITLDDLKAAFDHGFYHGPPGALFYSIKVMLEKLGIEVTE